MEPGITESSKHCSATKGTYGTLMALPFAIATCLFGIPGIAMAQGEMLNDQTNHVTRQATVRQPIHRGTQYQPTMLPPLDPNDPPPPSGSNSQNITLNAFDLNTQKHQAKIILSNGFVAIIDGAKEKVIMKYAGQTATVSLDKALLKWAHGNKSVANQRKQKLLAKLYSKANNARLMQLDDSNASVRFTSSHGFGFSPNRNHAHANVIMLPPVYVTAPMPPYSCYDFVWGCSYSTVRRHTRDSNHVPYGFSRPNLSPPSDQRGTNYEAWNAWRLDHCDDATSDQISFAEAGAGGLGAAVGIILASNPIGWVAGGIMLAAATVDAGWQMIQYQEDERICKSNYPGPGNWP